MEAKHEGKSDPENLTNRRTRRLMKGIQFSLVRFDQLRRMKERCCAFDNYITLLNANSTFRGDKVEFIVLYI